MSEALKRVLAIGLAVVLLAGIAVAIVLGQRPGDGGEAEEHTVVTGVIGSEKKPFFADPEVKAAFAAHGLEVQVSTAGSRQIATSVDLDGVDFVFPSSAPAAEKIEQSTSTKSVRAPFFSPLAIASYTPIAELLAQAGIARQDAAGQWVFDMTAYLDAVAKGTRWRDLPGAAETYNSSRELFVSSTDVRQSNSAGMYLSIASYVANGDRVVATTAEQSAVIDRMTDLFLKQGFSASSSEEPFEDYLAQGMGSKPLVMVYEAQFLGRQMSATGANAITPDMVLMYPSPTVYSKHTVVALTDAGDNVSSLLSEDAELARLAARYGFRPADPAVFDDMLAEHGLTAASIPVDVIDPPSYETLESMIQTISDRYTGAGAPEPSPESDATPSDPTDDPEGAP